MTSSVFLSAALGGLLLAGGESSEWQCAHGLAAAELGLERQYAPDRRMDVLHLRLDVTPDFARRSLTAQATLTFKPIAEPLRQIRLDAVDLRVSSVSASEEIEAYQVTLEAIVVTFRQAVPPGREVRVVIEYAADPQKGLYFRTADMGYPEGDTHLFTQGEMIEARHWYPSFDSPNERFTSEILCHVPERMIALSNGRLLAQTAEPEKGRVLFHWLQDKPHVNYLVSLVAGDFKKIEDKHRDIPMAFYVLPSEAAQAESSFRPTKSAMAFFEEEIRVPYPWDKYDQVTVRDFMFGGMENTSITTLTEGTLFTPATENIHSSDGLVAHELAHQWFGDLVTCKDWSQLWLNEGFATYYAHLFHGHQHGRDTMLFGLHQTARGLTGNPDSRPIVYRTYREPEGMFRAVSHLIYGKGAWVLHMLRSQLGPDLFRECVRTYLERRRFNTVVTEDLNSVIEEISGRSFDRFFDQWVYHGGVPELAIRYAWEEKTKLAKISVQQRQKVSPEVLLFHFPLPVRFQLKSGPVLHVFEVTQASEDFYLSLPEQPESVRVDPDYTLLAKIAFDVPSAMLDRQLTDTTDVIGRVLAIEKTAERKNREAVDKLKERLQQDPFYGVRIEASKALAGIHTDDAFKALQESAAQEDARVRLQVTADLGAWYRPEARAFALETLQKERNPAIQARALESLSGYTDPAIEPLLLSFLSRPSYQNSLADAVIRAMRTQDDPRYAGTIRQALLERAEPFTSRGLGQALESLAFLARHESSKQPVRDFLLGYLQDQRQRVRVAALNALGTLNDPTALAAVQKFAGAKQQETIRQAAERSVAALRAGKPVDAEVRQLRDEVIELQKLNRALRDEFDQLKKKFEALPSTNAPPAPKAAE